MLCKSLALTHYGSRSEERVEQAHIGHYKEFLLILAVAGILVPLLVRLGLNSILGFLLVGVLLSPSVAGMFADAVPLLKNLILSDAEGLTSVGELGVVFLLFLIGLELSFERLYLLRKLVFGLGGLQVLISTAVLYAGARLFGLSPETALVTAAALSLSSTAIIVQLYSDTKRLASQPGRAAFAVLLMQDLAVIPILFLASALGGEQGSSLASGIGMALAQAAVAIATILLIGRYVLRPLLRMVAGTHSSDLFMAIVLLTAVGTGVIAGYFGLSMALGAFLAGLTLAETEYRRAIEAILEPFKGLLLGAFFLLVGISVDIGILLANPTGILAAAIAVIVIKAAIIYTLARLMKLPHATALEIGLLLGACGEFAMVILASAKSLGLVGLPLYSQLLPVVILTMMAIPLLALLTRHLLKLKMPGNTAGVPALLPPSDTQPHVIIAGFGRVGRLLGDMLKEHKVPYVAIDSDASNAARAHKEGYPVYFGDASNAEFLKICGIDGAMVIAVTMDISDRVDDVVTTVRQYWKDIKIIARARDEKHAQRLYDEGVSDAVPETIEASLQLGESILVEAGIAMGLAIASVHERRDVYRKLLGRPNRRQELASLRKRMRRVKSETENQA
jgi:CPA2 family monovalent cation:H+ antiporter-2